MSAKASQSLGISGNEDDAQPNEKFRHGKGKVRGCPFRDVSRLHVHGLTSRPSRPAAPPLTAVYGPDSSIILRVDLAGFSILNICWLIRYQDTSSLVSQTEPATTDGTVHTVQTMANFFCAATVSLRLLLPNEY